MNPGAVLRAMTGAAGRLSWVGLLLAATVVLTACAGLINPPAAEAQLISPVEYQDYAQTTEHMLIDVRTPEEFASGHIPGAVNISVESLAARLDEVPEDQPIVVYCRSGNRSATAADILVENGYQPVYDLGGIIDWVEQGFAIE